MAVCATAPHATTLGAGFTFDDRDFVVKNASIRTIGAAIGSFARPFPPEQPERGLFRPLTNLSYALDYAWSGDAAWGYHLTNLALYAIVCLLVLALLRRLVPGAALVASVLFAVHPVHAEVADSVAGRSELLALGFALLALAAFMASERRSSRLSGAPGVALTTLAFALSALSKESGVMTVFVLAAYGLVVARRPWRGLAKALAPSVAVAACYAALRAHALGGRMKPSFTVLGGQPVATKIFTAGAVYLEDARLLVWPSTLDVDYYYQAAIRLHHGPSLAAIGGLALAAAVLAWLALLVRAAGRGDAPRARLSAFGLLAFVAFFLPTSQLVPFGALMAERFLFAPSAGLALVAAVGLDALTERRRAAAFAAAAAVSVAFAARGALRAREWRDEVTLWSVTASRVSGDPRVYLSVGRGYLRRGDGDAGAWWLNKALEADPSYAPAILDLGYLQMERGDLDGARATFARVLTLTPDDPVVHNNLGVVAVRSRRYVTARGHYARALSLNPNYAQAQQNLASVDAALARASAVRDAHGADIGAIPDHGTASTLARACLLLEDLPCARAAYARALAASPDPAAARDPVLDGLR